MGNSELSLINLEGFIFDQRDTMVKAAQNRLEAARANFREALTQSEVDASIYALAAAEWSLRAILTAKREINQGGRVCD